MAIPHKEASESPECDIVALWINSVFGDELQVRRKKAEAADLCQISIVVQRFLRKKNLPFPSFLRV